MSDDKPIGVHLNLKWRDPLDYVFVLFADRLDELTEDVRVSPYVADRMADAFAQAWREVVDKQLRPLLKPPEVS